MEFPWMAFNAFDAKLDARLEILARDGKTPTTEQWEKARAMRLALQDKACRFYKNEMGEWKIDIRNPSITTERYVYTNKLFQQAMAATKACSAFWTTKEGQELNAVNEVRRNAWEVLEEAGATNLFVVYNNFITSEVGLSFYDAEEYDNQVVNAQSQTDMLEEILKVEQGEVDNNGQEVFLDDDAAFDDSSFANHRVASPRGFWRPRENFRRGRVVFQAADKMEVAAQDSMIDAMCA
jgi:hypothetical protein